MQLKSNHIGVECHWFNVYVNGGLAATIHRNFLKQFIGTFKPSSTIYDDATKELLRED